MTNSNTRTHRAASAVMIVLSAAAIAACSAPAPKETKIAAVDTTAQAKPQMPMEMAGMPMGQMMGPCPLGLVTLSLTAAQQATFDSIKTDHKASMQREMQATLARARAVLTPAQQVKFDSASAVHMAQMTKMMSGRGGCMG